MNAIRTIVPSRSFDLDLSARGYQVLFRANETNRCPGCGHAQWLVGRITAECCICGTALPLENSELAAAPARKAVALHVVDSARVRARGTVENRREARQPGKGRVLALFVDGSPHPFAIDNISSGGVMGEAPAGIEQARSLRVELEDGTMLPAELKWTDGQAVGLAFLSPNGSRQNG